MERICREGTERQWKLEELLVTGTLPDVGGKHKNHFSGPFLIDSPMKELIVSHGTSCLKYTPRMYVISPNSFVLLQLFPVPLPSCPVRSYKGSKVEIYPVID